MHRLNLTIRLQPLLPQLPPNPTLLDTSERNPRVTVLTTIDPDHTGLDLRGDAVRALQVLREDGRAETVARVVGAADGFLFRGEGHDGDDGAEDLFAVDTHGVRDVREDGGLDEVAILELGVGRGMGMAACEDGCALGARRVDVREDAVILGASHLGTLEGGLGPLVADAGGGFEGVFEFLKEGRHDVLVDKDAGGSGADLALVGHDAEMGPFGGLVEVGFGEDEERRFTPRFERDVLHRAGGHFHDLFAGQRGAGECDLVDEWMLHQRGAGFAAVAVDQVHDAWRETGFFDQSAEDEDAEWCLLGGLEHYRVAAGESRSKLPGGHGKGIVPWDDLSHDTDGLAERVRQLLRGSANGLTKRLVSPAAVVSDSGDGLC